MHIVPNHSRPACTVQRCSLARLYQFVDQSADTFVLSPSLDDQMDSWSYSELGRTDQHGFEILVVKLEARAKSTCSVFSALHGDSCCCSVLNKQQKSKQQIDYTLFSLAGLSMESMAPRYIII